MYKLITFLGGKSVALLDSVSAVGVAQRAPQVPRVLECLGLAVVAAVHGLAPHLLALLDPPLPQGPALVPRVARRVLRNVLRRDPGLAAVAGEVHP